MMRNYGDPVNEIIIERMCYIQYMMMDKHDFETIEEVDEEFEKLMDRSPDEYEPKSDRERAQMLVYDGYLEESENKMRENALKALEIDSMCGDAYTLLGYANTEDPEQAVEYMLMGEKILSQRFPESFMEENSGMIYHIIEARPYLRNLIYTFYLYDLLNQFDKAIEIGKRLLELCIMDKMNVMPKTLMLLIQKGEWKEVKKILQSRAADSDAPGILFAKSIYCHHWKKNRKKAIKYAKKLFKKSDYIRRFFAGTYIPAETYSGNESPEEIDANEFILNFSKMFAFNPEPAKKWIDLIRQTAQR